MKRGLRRESFVYFVFVLLSVLAFQTVQAQEYPTKPVTLIIPLSAGGSHDLTMRIGPDRVEKISRTAHRHCKQTRWRWSGRH